MTSVVSGPDYVELRKNYTFLPEQERVGESWQDRMVLQYHQHLYKDYVLANTTRVHSHKQLGLRWRTEKEVRIGKGSSSCGNLQCPGIIENGSKKTVEAKQVLALYLNSTYPSNEAEEVENLSVLFHGTFLSDYEVPFTYKEHGTKKTELVKVCLCARCAPLLFVSRGDPTPSLTARQNRDGRKEESDPSKEKHSEAGVSLDHMNRHSQLPNDSTTHASSSSTSEASTSSPHDTTKRTASSHGRTREEES